MMLKRWLSRSRPIIKTDIDPRLVELDTMERLLVLLRPKAPYVEWVRRTCREGNFTLEEAHKGTNGYLVPTIHWDIQEALDYVNDSYDLFFDRELTLWSLDPDQWPKPRTPALFHAWFDVEVIEMVADLGDY